MLPPEIPRANLEYWEGVFRRLMQTASFKKYVADNQFEDGFLGSADLIKFMDRYNEQMRSILKDAGVKTVR